MTGVFKYRQPILAANGVIVGNVDSGNYALFNEDGVRLYGTSTGWDDLRIDATQAPLGVIAPTDETGFRGDANFMARNFVHTQADEIQFPAQFPHNWKEGSTVYPHFHFSPWEAGSASTNQVQFILEFYPANVGEQFSATPTTASLLKTWTGNNQWYNSIAGTGGAGVDMTGYRLSTILKCRLYRDNTVASNLGAKVTGLYFDIHYEVDSLGSEEEYTKE